MVLLLLLKMTGNGATAAAKQGLAVAYYFAVAAAVPLCPVISPSPKTKEMANAALLEVFMVLAMLWRQKQTKMAVSGPQLLMVCKVAVS